MTEIKARDLEQLNGGIGAGQAGGVEDEPQGHEITTNEDSPFSNDNTEWIEL